MDDEMEKFLRNNPDIPRALVERRLKEKRGGIIRDLPDGEWRLLPPPAQDWIERWLPE